MVEKEKLEEKIDECIGLERAAQRAVNDLDSKGLFVEPEIKKKIWQCSKRRAATS